MGGITDVLVINYWYDTGCISKPLSVSGTQTPLKINQTGLRLLSYSAPAVLAAVIAPLVFVHDKQLDLAWDNSYMIAAVAAAGLMIITKNTLLTASLSLVLFILINQ